MTRRNQSTEEALGTLSPLEMIKYIIESNLDSMDETYSERLDSSTRRRILAERQLDLTDSYQRAIGKRWMKEK